LCSTLLISLPIPGAGQDNYASDTAAQTDTALVEDGRALTITLENDLFIGEDNQYTNGFALLYSRGVFDQFDSAHLPSWMLSLVKHTHIYTLPDRKRALVYTLAQRMQTPEDIQSTELQIDDVPYAGLLLAGLSLYAADEHRSDRITLAAGVVGPASLARQSQEIVHRATGSEIPQGWSNQLNNEPVFQLGVRRGWRLFNTPAKHKLEMDVLGFADATLGNLRSAVSASVVLRLGDNLASSHPTNTLVPDREANILAYSQNNGWYVYAGLESFWVANDLLVQGNTFADSHSLDLNRRRDRLGAGVGWNLQRWAFTLVYADLTSNGDSDPFGSMSFTRRF